MRGPDAVPCEDAVGHARRRLATGRPRREKTFVHRPRRIDRNERVRILFHAKAISSKLRGKGSHGGPLTHAREKVLRALLYDFLNWQDGRCYPSYQRLAKTAGVARSTVAEAIKVIEALGVMRVVNRIIRVRWHERDAAGQVGERWRVMRTSNSYEFIPPKSHGTERGVQGGDGNPTPRQPSKSGSRTGTLSKSHNSSPLLEAALARLGKAIASCAAVNGLAAAGHGR